MNEIKGWLELEIRTQRCKSTLQRLIYWSGFPSPKEVKGKKVWNEKEVRSWLEANRLPISSLRYRKKQEGYYVR